MKTKITYLFLISIFLLFLKIDYRLVERFGCCSDDYDYYSHAETLILDFDFDYSNQLSGYEQDRFFKNEKSAPMGFFGSGLLASPFLFIGNILDQIKIKLFNNQSSLLNYKVLLYSFSSIFYLLFTVKIVQKTLRALEIRDFSSNLLFVLLFGSGLGYFSFERFSMTHVYEAFTISLVIYLSLLYYLDEKKKKLSSFLIPFSILLSFLVRWTNYFVLFIPVLIRLLVKSRKKILYEPLFYIASLISALLFSLHSNLIYGFVTFNPRNVYASHNFVDDYFNLISEPINFFILNFTSFFNILFTQEFGLFWFSPLIFSLVAIWLINYKNPKLFIILTLTILPNFGIVILWQGTADSYGFRYLFALIPVAVVMTAIHKKKYSQSRIFRYVIYFSFISSLGILFFDTTFQTQLSEGFVLNSFGRMDKYSEPLYLTGFLDSVLNFESYLKIFSTSFLGVFIFKLFLIILGKEGLLQILSNFGLPVENNDFIVLLNKTDLLGIDNILVIIFLSFIFVKNLNNNTKNY